MIDCRHLGVSQEAYRGDERIIVHLCNWENANRAALQDAPPWLLRIIGNCAVMPEKDCVNCPAYQPLTRPVTESRT